MSGFSVFEWVIIVLLCCGLLALIVWWVIVVLWLGHEIIYYGRRFLQWCKRVPKQTVGIRIVLVIYLVAVAGICLYVPSYTINVPSYALRSGLKLEFAYRWVWALNYGLSIDFGRVVSELIGLTAVAGVPALLLIGSLVGGRKRENNTTT